MYTILLCIIFACTHLVAMFNDADTWTVVSEQFCASFIEHRSTDDQLACALRSLTKVLCTKIDAYRERKRIMFNTWMGQLCTDSRPHEGEKFHNQEQIAHKLRIKKDGTLSCSWGSSSVMFADKGPDFSKYQIEDSFIIPLSVRIGPSGNTVYALLARHAYNNKISDSQYIDSVKFLLDEHGYISVSNMQIMPDFFDKNLKSVTDSCGQLNCFTDTDQRRLCALALPYNGSDGCLIAGSATSVYYAHQRSMFPFHAYAPVHRQPRLICNDDSMSIVIDAMSIKPLSGYNSQYLDYACTNGGKELLCKAHYLKLSDGTVLDMAQLSVKSFTNLTAYLHYCPIVCQAGVSFHQSPYADNCVVHVFAPHEQCSQKFFDTIIDIQRDKDDTCVSTIVRNADLQHVTDYVCAALLAGGIVEYYLPMLAKRFQEKKLPNARLYFDPVGTVGYDAGAAGHFLLKKPTNIAMHCMRILHDWAQCVEPGVSFGDTLKYLYHNANTVFTLHTSHLVTCLKRKAREYAQYSWDNGTIGVTWAYTDGKDMLLSFFDLTSAKKKKLGEYTIQGHLLMQGMKSNVTNVTHTSQQSFTVWIDGKSFIL